MTPLRQRLIEEIALRGYSDKTKEAYVRAVACLAQHYRRPPDRLSDEELRAYLLHLHQDSPKAASTLNVAVSGLRSLPPAARAPRPQRGPDPGRAGQGTQGPLHRAAPPAAAGVGSLLADVPPPGRLALPQHAQPAGAPARRHRPEDLLPGSGARRPARQGRHPLSSSLLRHALDGSGPAALRAQASAGPHQPLDHQQVSAREPGAPGQDQEPARPTGRSGAAPRATQRGPEPHALSGRALAQAGRSR